MSILKKNNKCFPIRSFYSMDTNNISEKIELHENTNMPEEGWIQGCVKCGVYTSYTTQFERSTYINKDCDFCFYLCRHCKNIISDDVKEYIIFSKKCNKMIRKYKIKNLKINLDKELIDTGELRVSTYGHTDLEAELPEISIS
jgi:hypothetical protein